MAGRIEKRLKDIGITLPNAPAPVANYVPFVVHRELVFVSGQVPFVGSSMSYVGTVGGNLSLEDGQQAARICALNVLSQLRVACSGDLDRVTRCVRLGGFVNAALNFKLHPQIINGASDLMVQVFGDAGRHARFAVGAQNLPGGAAVEVEGIFAIA